MIFKKQFKFLMGSFFISILGLSPCSSKPVYQKAKFRSSKLPHSSSKTKSAYLKPEYAGFVMDADTGQILETHEGDSLRHPASLTKMMTLYMVFKGLKTGQITLNTLMPVSFHAASQAPSKLGLKPGETLSVNHAILALVTKSANDVAAVVAEYLGKTEPAFAQKMTAQARSIGMKNTTFANASGLPNPRQISTARDMAILSRTLYKEFPQFFGHFKLRSFNYKGSDHQNHNHLLGKVPGIDGIKTGYTAASGSNLAATAVRYNDHNQSKRLIVVVLGGKNRHWRDAKVTELLEHHYHQLGYKNNYDKIASAQLTLTNLIQSTQQKLTPKAVSFKAPQVKKGTTVLRRTNYQAATAPIRQEKKNKSNSNASPTPSVNRNNLTQFIQKINYQTESKPPLSSNSSLEKSKSLQPAGWVVPAPPILSKAPSSAAKR